MYGARQTYFEHVVCGAGLVGALWALYLRRKSASVAIFQSYQDLRQQLIPGGRSINLVLSKKALDSFQQLGIREEILKCTIPIKGQAIHQLDGHCTKLHYGIGQQDMSYCIARNKLNEILLNIIDNNNIPVYYQHSLVEGDLDAGQYLFKDSRYEEEADVRVRAKYLYGADGAGSKVRDLIFERKQIQSNVDWLDAEYKELFLPACNQSFNGYAYDPNWVHVWPRGQHMMMAHANPNGSFSLTIVLPSQGQHSFASIDTQEKVYAFYDKFYSELVDKIPNLAVQFTENPVGYLGTVKCEAWHYMDKAVLIGDSAHTITPFVWQAVNSGMDDCLHLNRIIQEHGFGEQAFAQYERLQKPKADALSELALQNYQTLASNNSQAEFIELKKLEKQIETSCPQHFWSKYRMIFYSDFGYDQICRLAPKFEKILYEIRDKRVSSSNIQLYVTEKMLNDLSLKCS